MRFDYQQQLDDERRLWEEEKERSEKTNEEYLAVNREFMKRTRSEWNVEKSWPFKSSK